jgi:hypothetical protein
MKLLATHLLPSLVLLGVHWCLGAPRLYACDPAWLPIVRSTALTYFVATATADTLLESVARQRGAMPPSGFDGRLHQGIGRSRGGQRVRVELLRGAGADSLAGRVPTQAVVVPWAYGPDCTPMAWTESLRWIRPGTQGFMTGWLRPRERWLAGVPTFDVEMAWREPLWVREDPRWQPPGRRDKLLDPAEFVELYEALPEWEQLERAPGKTAAELRRWEHDHAELANRPPARTILDNVFRAAAERIRTRGL